jgi:hypothetical protein
MDAMDWIDLVQLNIDKNNTKYQDKKFKEHFKYLKERNKKTHKINKHMMNVVSNFIIVMCHAFHQPFMPLLINLFEYDYNDQPLENNQNIE